MKLTRIKKLSPLKFQFSELPYGADRTKQISSNYDFLDDDDLKFIFELDAQYCDDNKEYLNFIKSIVKKSVELIQIRFFIFLIHLRYKIIIQ